MLSLTHGVWHLYSLRRLANVEMFSVTLCVERKLWQCCGFSCFKFHTIRHFVFRINRIRIEENKLNYNQEQRGRQ